MKLFDLIQDSIAKAATRTSIGLANSSEFKTAMTEDIKYAVDETGKELTRWEITARMSNILNKEVTWHMINNWTAPSHDGHMPDLDEMVAFIIATGGQRRALTVLLKPTGIFPLPSPQALGSEAHRIDESISSLKKEKRTIVNLKRQLEKGVSA